MNNLLPEAAQIAAKCGLASGQFSSVPVHYMGQGIWELGFVPKQVTFSSGVILSNEVVLWHNEKPVRNQHCVFGDNVWERYPD